MKIPLVSAFLEDDVYETRLTDKFMENVICNEDHFYHRTARALTQQQLEPIVYYLSQEKSLKKFTHKYGHTIIRVPSKRINFFHEPIVYSSQLIDLMKDFEICDFVSGYYIKYKIPDMFDYSVFKLHKKIPLLTRWTGGNHKWLFPLRKSIKKGIKNKGYSLKYKIKSMSIYNGRLQQPPTRNLPSAYQKVSKKDFIFEFEN